MANKKILAVDDEKNILELEKVLFIKSGYQVITASNGNEAIAAALRETPDLIVLDVEMPQKDGFATLLEMRGLDNLKDIPVIILSGLKDEIHHKLSASLGSVSHLDKPFDPNKLLSKVKEIIG
ncbi:response regulator receiver protein [Candidatus Magnetoovum chiemensis]|nr:response regulator receiver protein [Candidatus Magnetoovum chiemensis]